jgi:glycosyltransferase involved in cell wall biosynthesis
MNRIIYGKPHGEKYHGRDAMKVLLTITGLGMGGAERMVADLADRLVATGCQVLVVYLKGPLQVHPRRAEVNVVGLGMNSPKSILEGCFKLRKLIREFRPDIVHSHMFHATLLTRLLRLTTSVPRMISTMHAGYAGGPFRVLAYRLTDRLTDISTNVSCVAMDNFVASHAVRLGRMVVVYNGISVEEFQPSFETRARIRTSFGVAEDCKLFLAVGRLVPQKDYPNLLQALARLPHELDFRLLIAGDGPLRPQLEAMVDDLGLSSRVRLLGIRQDVPALMAAADVFVLSSVGEPFGLVVAEAMASECVVVATDTGGVREVLGDTGFLVPRSDPSALADALRTACALRHEDAIKLGRAARQRVVDSYSLDRSFERWRELYGRPSYDAAIELGQKAG